MNKLFLSALTAAVSLMSLPSHASSLKTHAFTKEFVNCVKRHKSDEADYDTVGVADSALMNGTTVLASGGLGNYWSYMNCLSASSSGDAQASVDSVDSCAPKYVAVGDNFVYLGGGILGKEIQVSGYNFKCVNGEWVSTSSVGTPSSPCEATTMTVGACTFELFGARSDEYVNAVNLTGGYKGNLVAKCENGGYSIKQQSCEQITCEQGKRVSWFDQTQGSAAASRGVVCTGEIAVNGVVVAETVPTRYYPTESQARQHTRIAVGESIYACQAGAWHRISSVCAVKQPNELTCQSVEVGGKTEFKCQ